MNKRRISPVKVELIHEDSCNPHLRYDILGQLPFFSMLSEEEIHKINHLLIYQGFMPEETIYFMGDRATQLYIVASGRVKLIRHTSEGTDILMDILKPGEFFGTLTTLGDNEYAETSVAQTVTCALKINAQDFRTLLEHNPLVSLKIIDIMSERLRSANEMIKQLSAQSVEYRIIASLLKLADKFGEVKDVGLLIQLPLSRLEIAEMTGTTPETASRIISNLQKQGYIKTGRQWIALSNRERFAALISE